MTLRVGEEGPEDKAIETALDFGKLSVIEPDRGPTDAFREDDSEEGIVGARTGGCCRMRLKPEAPRPCSCSVMMGDLYKNLSQHQWLYGLCLTRLQKQEKPRDRDLQLPRKRQGKATTTNLDIVSYSAAAKLASKEKRILAFSVPFGACASRFPVLRFLGMKSSLGD